MTKKISQFELTKYILENVNYDNSGLDMKEYIVLVTLSGHLNSTTLLCNPSKATLANRSCMGERTVDEAVKGLVAKGFISYEKGGLRGKLREPNKYTIVTDKVFSCVKKGWTAPEAKENLIEAPVVVKKQQSEVIPESAYKKQYHGKWYYSEGEYLAAVERQRIENMNLQDDPGCPF